MNGTASSFASDSENRFETLDSAADADIGYWVGFQRSQANMRGQDQPVLFDLRMTEIYRREHDPMEARVHRHADSLHTVAVSVILRNGRKFGPVQSATEQSR